MAEKKSVNKLLALLLVLVALSLVVDLLSLNVLYGIKDSSALPSGSQQGELLATNWNCFDQCVGECVDWYVADYLPYDYNLNAIYGQCRNECSSSRKGISGTGDCCYIKGDYFDYFGCCTVSNFENGYC